MENGPANVHHLAPYVPRWVLDGGREGRHEGTLLLADVSGFTALSEALAGMGREGAEQLTGYINLIFDPLVEAALTRGGDIMSFGGDALLAFFPLTPQDRDIRRALATAWSMQESLSLVPAINLPGAAPVNVNVHIGIHSGTINLLACGDSHSRLEVSLTGQACEMVAGLESEAGRGETRVSDATAHRLIQKTILVPAPGGHHLLAAPPEDLPALLDKNPMLWSGATQHLPSRFLSSELLPALGGRPEHRYLATCFANVWDPAGPEPTVLSWQKVYRLAVAEALRVGVVFSRSDIASRGEKLLFFSGFPRADDHAAERILELAHVLTRRVETETGMLCRAGCTVGAAFAGEVGGKRRRELTVMGDAVNTAARLMAAATPGQVLVAEDMRKRASRAFHFSPKGKMNFKGKSASLDVYQVEHHAPRQDAHWVAPWVGREATRRHAQEVLEQNGAVHLVGAPGLGKAALAYSLADMAEREALWMSSTPADEHAPFGLWIRLWKKLADLSGSLDGLEIGQLDQLLGDLGLDPASERKGLMAWLFPAVSASPTEAPLDVDFMPQERFVELTLRLVRRRVLDRGMALIVMRAQWLDPASTGLLQRLLRTPNLRQNLFLVVGSRPGWGLDDLPVVTLPVLEEESWPQYARVVIGMELEKPLTDLLAQRSGGNPRVGEGILQVLLEGNWATLHPTTGRVLLRQQPPTQILPDHLQGVGLMPLNHLSPQQRDMLQRAAVCGHRFDLPELMVLSELSERRVEGVLRQLEKTGLIKRQEQCWEFADLTVWEALNESLPGAQRRDWHRTLYDQFADGTDPDLAWRHAELVDELANQELPGYLEHLFSGERYDELLSLALRRGLLVAEAPELPLITALTLNRCLYIKSQARLFVEFVRATWRRFKAHPLTFPSGWDKAAYLANSLSLINSSIGEVKELMPELPSYAQEYVLGRWYFLEKDFRNAAEAYHRALSANIPEDYLIHFTSLFPNQIQCLYLLGEQDWLLEEVRRSLPKQESLMSAHARLGLAGNLLGYGVNWSLDDLVAEGRRLGEENLELCSQFHPKLSYYINLYDALKDRDHEVGKDAATKALELSEFSDQPLTVATAMYNYLECFGFKNNSALTQRARALIESLNDSDFLKDFLALENKL